MGVTGSMYVLAPVMNGARGACALPTRSLLPSAIHVAFDHAVGGGSKVVDVRQARQARHVEERMKTECKIGLDMSWHLEREAACGSHCDATSLHCISQALSIWL